MALASGSEGPKSYYALREESKHSVAKGKRSEKTARGKKKNNAGETSLAFKYPYPLKSPSTIQ